MSSSSVVRVNGTDVGTDAPDRTVINITINQGSSLACLMDSMKSLGQGIGSVGAKTPIPKITVSKGEQKTLGAVQIIAGVILVAFGIDLYFGPYSALTWNGVLFWTGVPFILSGVVSVLSERRPSCCWLFLSPWMNLLSFAVSIAGIVFLANNLTWWFNSELCERRRSYYSNEPTAGYEGYDPDSWKVDDCKNMMARSVNYGTGANIILLLLMILVLCITFFSVGYGWKVLCCGKSSQQDESVEANENAEPLLASEAHPPPYEEKIGNVETV
uniref:Transmembrane protein 176B n=1 Tax=Geotrypetes seraphini TaxID=260995 RepID=A0A6P8NLN3_GEOSA|nr:transmembrane protein 176B [Geotrypetes seraphini]